MSILDGFLFWIGKQLAEFAVLLLFCGVVVFVFRRSRSTGESNG